MQIVHLQTQIINISRKEERNINPPVHSLVELEKTMKSYLMYSVSAIALVTALGFANAQTSERQGAAGPGAPASESRAPAEKGGEQGKAPEARQHQEKSAQTPGQTEQHKKSGTETQPGQTQRKSTEGQMQERQPDTHQQGKTTGKAAEQSVERPATGSDERKQNEGQRQSQAHEDGGHDARVNINVTSEQKTRMHDVIVGDSEIRKYHRSDITFAIDVGTRIPESAVYYDPPARLVEIVPDVRRYKIIVLDDVMLVVDPETREIVDVIQI
jgi:hypothetical protein